MQKDFENYTAAVASYRESLRRQATQPDREQILLELAECQMKLREYAEALVTLSEARGSADRWAAEAECQYNTGHAPEARRLLEQALAEAPAHLPALMLLGTMALDEGKAAAAVEAFSRAVTAYPKDYTARFRLSAAYRRAGNEGLAKQHAEAADQLKRWRLEFTKLHATAAAEPDNAEARCRLGELARELDRPDLAQVWFRAALAIDPRHARTLRNLLGPGGAPKSDAPKGIKIAN